MLQLIAFVSTMMVKLPKLMFCFFLLVGRCMPQSDHCPPPQKPTSFRPLATSRYCNSMVHPLDGDGAWNVWAWEQHCDVWLLALSRNMPPAIVGFERRNSWAFTIVDLGDQSSSDEQPSRIRVFRGDCQWSHPTCAHQLAMTYGCQDLIVHSE